jgi:hypothetical protein
MNPGWKKYQFVDRKTEPMRMLAKRKLQKCLAKRKLREIFAKK